MIPFQNQTNSYQEKGRDWVLIVGQAWWGQERGAFLLFAPPSLLERVLLSDPIIKQAHEPSGTVMLAWVNNKGPTESAY